MKDLFKMWKIAVLIIAVAFVFGACELGGNGDDGTGDPIDIDYESHSPFSIMVSNNTDYNLVGFKNSVAMDNKIGGVYRLTQNHGFKNDIFGTTVSAFPVFFITEAEYNAKKANLSTATIFTRIYVFWNGQIGDSTKLYEISGRVGGEYRLEVTNPSANFNIELRLDGPAGLTLGYAPSGLNSYNFYLAGGAYDIYPVFRRFNNKGNGEGRLETVYPSGTGGGPWAYGVSLNDDLVNKHYLMDLADAFGKVTLSMSSGAAYLLIKNETTGGGFISFLRGGAPQYSAVGQLEWNSGFAREFAIPMGSVQGGNNYTESVTHNNFNIRQGNRPPIAMEDENGNTSLTFKNDMLYIVNVTGDSNAATLKAVVVLDEEALVDKPIKINFNEYGVW